MPAIKDVKKEKQRKQEIDWQRKRERKKERPL